MAKRRVSLFFSLNCLYYERFQTLIAQMVELVDTLVSGTSSRKAVEVQVFSWALEEPESQDFGSFLFLAHLGAEPLPRGGGACRFYLSLHHGYP